jgi:hypothetical protein
MATEYDLLRLLLTRQEKHNEETATPFDKPIKITGSPFHKRKSITRVLLSLFRKKPSWVGQVGNSREPV